MNATLRKGLAAMLLALAVVGLVLSVARPADAGIRGYVTVYNYTGGQIEFYLDGDYLGVIENGRRSSWYVGDEDDDTGHTLTAYGADDSWQEVVNGSYSNFTWTVP